MKRQPPYLHDGSSERPTELEEPERVHVGQLRRLSLLVDDVLSRWVTRETHDRLERRVAQLERWGVTRDTAALLLLGATVTLLLLGATVTWSVLVTAAAVMVLVLAW